MDWLTSLQAQQIVVVPVPGKPEIHVNDPRCQDTKQHLYFNTVKEVGYCQKCGQPVTKDEFRRLMGLAPQSLRDQVGDVRQEIQRSRKTLYPEWSRARATDWFPSHAVPVEQNAEALAFLRERQWSDARIARAVPYATPRGDHPMDGRVIFPVVQQEAVLFWVGRDYTKQRLPKYLYPSGAPVSHSLYPWDFVMRKPRQHVWLVEGLFDAWHLFPHALCLWSLNFSKAQRNLLLEAGVRELWFCWDADVWSPTRPDLAIQIHKIAREAMQWFRVKLVKLPDGDPTDHPAHELLLKGEKTPCLSRYQ